MVSMKNVLLSLFAILAVWPSCASACDYPDPGNAVDMINDAEVVFAGFIEEILASSVKLEFNEDNKIIGYERPVKPTRGVILRVTPVKVYKGYVPDTVQLITNVSCSGQFWMADTGRLRIITAKRDDWGHPEFGYYEPLGQRDPTQKDFINYLEKGIEPEADCPTIKLPNSAVAEGVNDYKVRCHTLPRNIDDPFRFIPPSPSAQ